MKFPFFKQINNADCGPACLKMISSFFGKNIDNFAVRQLCKVGEYGTSFDNLSKAAEYIGFNTLFVKLSVENLNKEIQLPCIALWQQKHFVVIYKITPFFILIADPSKGCLTYTKKSFCRNWINEDRKGILMLLENSENENKKSFENRNSSKIIQFLMEHVKPYKFLIFQLGIGLILGSLIQVVIPMLTQILVDTGINTKNVSFMYIILIGQLLLFAGQTSVNLLKSWILLHIGTRLNMKMIYDHLNKLAKMNIVFFEKRKIGDLLQRIFDNKRIESFLTNSLTSTLFSIISLIVLSLVLIMYSLKIFLIFSAGSLLSVLWLSFFLKKRREIDNRYFTMYSENYNKIFQFIVGIRDIKLNSSEKKKINEWEVVQIRLFNIHARSLTISQLQNTGATFITQLKNILIIFIAAIGVVNNELTLGMMMAIILISGQLNVPVEQIANFIQTGQDAKLSSERLIEIQNQDDEGSNIKYSNVQIRNCDIIIDDLSYKYNTEDTNYTLKKINLKIKKGKITAIVGSSGSGKTTLLKLLLKFYNPTLGKISYDGWDLSEIDPQNLRKLCGVVMQDSYIFSDTILGNITLMDNAVNWNLIEYAVRVANIHEFIESLPYKYFSKIDGEGKGLSQGQKQRILIARAIYRNPSFLFLDEATNALDTASESIVMDNLSKFFKDRTVVVVAHRLSTVINADNIVVLEKGMIVESGNHTELIKNKSTYYNLIRNQLELNHEI